ncbi:hypothetical protein NPIL_322731 [Nephila pilipes]|uniref:Uncharacterized protein n=1 Tax=Nephila pilipes TaxID=299642 RepID=A0A8X6R169_NEPPI|nr:hypothetical protein NPIL_322731 [Nephila pilipes]
MTSYSQCSKPPIPVPNVKKHSGKLHPQTFLPCNTDFSIPPEMVCTQMHNGLETAHEEKLRDMSKLITSPSDADRGFSEPHGKVHDVT